MNELVNIYLYFIAMVIFIDVGVRIVIEFIKVAKSIYKNKQADKLAEISVLERRLKEL